MILSYASDIVVAPGESLEVFTSSDVGRLSARVVRLDSSGDTLVTANEWGAGGDLGTLPGREQICTTGSCIVIPAAPSLPGSGDLTAQLHVWPTTPGDGRRQGIISWGVGGVWLGLLPDGRVEATLGSTVSVASRVPLRPREWVRITLTLAVGVGELVLRVEPTSAWIVDEVSMERVKVKAWPRPSEDALLFGASTCSARAPEPATLRITDVFNGKIARPWLAALGSADLTAARQEVLDAEGTAILGRQLVATWDLAKATTRKVIDRGSGGHHGFTINTPTSAVTGPTWDGRTLDFRQAPEQYDALYFHDDDMDDARWSPDLEFRVPHEFASGIYGIELTDGHDRDVLPLAVRPAELGPVAPRALLLPTFTYVAYANQRWTPGEALALKLNTLRDEPAPQPGDEALRSRPDIGGGVYDRHTDGSAYVYSSRHRPIVDMRHDYRYRFTGEPRHFSADLEFARWLTARGFRYDVITDEDVHREGRALLDRYQTVITGSHPEYVSERIHTAMEGYVSTTGRLMYLGGNGYYYVTAVDPSHPHLIEVRRGPGGGNTNGDSPPGEAHLSVTGEPGGLWRLRGRPAQRIVGVGTTGMGWGRSAGYVQSRRDADRTSWIFDGLDANEPIGPGEGSFLGAASDEIDGAEPELGTPPTAKVIASSRGQHDERYVALDQGRGSDRGELDAPRADMVYAESPSGGRLFAVGSMGWTNAVMHGTNAARVTENVLRAFGETNS